MQAKNFEELKEQIWVQQEALFAEKVLLAQTVKYQVKIM